VIDEERMRSGHQLEFLQCFNTVGTVTALAFGLQKTRALIPKGFLLEEIQEEN